jgi:DNA-binding protein HU-beta
MTKAELISLISKSTGVEKAEVLHIVASFMGAIKKSLEEGENVYLRGFGSFIVKKRAEKKARNISMNTTITIPAHNIPAFKPARVFLDAVAVEKKKSKKKK